jgi:DNA polymerase
MLNWLAGEEWVLEAFRDKRDLYSEGASQFYQRTITKADKAERGMGKQVELSCGFGSGGPKIAITARRGTYGPPVIITNEEGTRWRDHYRTRHPHICGKGGLWQQGSEIMLHLFNGAQIEWKCMQVRGKRLYLPNGVWLDYSNLVYKGSNSWGKPDFAVQRRQGESRIYGSKFIQNVIEALSRLVLEGAMLEMSKKYRAVMQTHDEGVFVVPEAEAEEAKAYLEKLMTTPPAWCSNLPLECEVDYNVRYIK